MAVATASNELLAAAAAITPLLATLKSMQFSHLSLCSGLCFVYRNETFERGELSRAIAPTTVSDWIGEPCRAIDQLLLLSWFFHFHFLLFIYGVHPIGAHVLRPSLTVALTLLNLTKRPALRTEAQPTRLYCQLHAHAPRTLWRIEETIEDARSEVILRFYSLQLSSTAHGSVCDISTKSSSFLR